MKLKTIKLLYRLLLVVIVDARRLKRSNQITFILGNSIGKGGFAVVREASIQGQPEMFAVKIEKIRPKEEKKEHHHG